MGNEFNIKGRCHLAYAYGVTGKLKVFENLNYDGLNLDFTFPYQQL